MRSTLLEELSDIVALLRGADLRGLSVEKLQSRLTSVLQHYRISPVLYDHRQICYRARRCKNEKAWPNINDCLNPQNGSPEYGRASLPNQSVLYSSWNMHTALDEINAQAGDVVQVVGFNVVPGNQVLLQKVGDIERFQNSGRCLFDDPPGQNIMKQFQITDPETYRASLLIDSLLAELFSKSTARDHEYMITAHFG